jgi:hypothetical protein
VPTNTSFLAVPRTVHAPSALADRTGADDVTVTPAAIAIAATSAALLVRLAVGRPRDRACPVIITGC